MNRKQPLNAYDDDVTVFADMKEMKAYFHTALQFDKERQSVILQSIGDAVIATDMEGNIVLINKIAENLTGWNSKDAENKPIAEVLHIINAHTREKCDNPVEVVLQTGSTIKLEPDTVLVSKDDDNEYAISDSCAPILDMKGNIMGAVLVFRNVTRQKQDEALKEKITADLVQRNRDHEHFDNIISHDLKGHVSNIISLTTLVNDKNLGEEEREFMLNALTTSAEKLNEVIDDLNVILSIGKQWNEKKEQVQFSKLVNDIQGSIANSLDKQQAQFIMDFSQVDGMVTVKSYMYSIFYNLISNGIKYRNPSVPLEIAITSQRVDDKINLTFKDNGLGIDLKKHEDTLFGLYQRFHVDNAEGKGMGLYMVKVQVEKLGGTISVDSKVGEGTIFTITVP